MNRTNVRSQVRRRQMVGRYKFRKNLLTLLLPQASPPPPGPGRVICHLPTASPPRRRRRRSGSAIFFSLIEILLIGLLLWGAYIVELAIHHQILRPLNRQNSQPIFRLSRIADDRLCVQVGCQKIISFDLSDQKNNQTEFRTTGPPLAVSRSAEMAQTFIVSLEYREIEIVRNHELLIAYQPPSGTTVVDLSLSADRMTAILVLSENTIRCWDLSSSNPTWTDYEIPKAVDRIALSPSGKTLITCTDQGAMDLYEAATGVLIKSLAEGEPVKSELVFSDDGNWLAFASSQTLFLYDMHSLKFAGKIAITPSTGSQHVAISHDGRLLAVSHFGMGIQVLSGSCGETVCTFKPDYSHYRLEFSKSGDALYTTSIGDGSIRIWSLSTGREREPLKATTCDSLRRPKRSQNTGTS